MTSFKRCIPAGTVLGYYAPFISFRLPIVFQIYDGSLDKIYGFYCGQELPPLVTTETNVMYVKFVTDGDDNQDFQGFTAIYSHVKGQDEKMTV